MRFRSKFKVQSSRSTLRRRVDETSTSIARTLIYGFGPYRQFDANITEKIVRALPRPNRLHKIVFPVRFNKKQFIEAVERFRPDVILGLGQCSAGRLLRIETRALNRRRNSKLHAGRPIVPNGPRRLAANLKIKLGRRARASKNAGDYVCNYSMYVMLDYIKRQDLPILYGFVHVPHSYDPKLALRLVRRILRSPMFKVQSSQ